MVQRTIRFLTINWVCSGRYNVTDRISKICLLEVRSEHFLRHSTSTFSPTNCYCIRRTYCMLILKQSYYYWPMIAGTKNYLIPPDMHLWVCAIGGGPVFGCILIDNLQYWQTLKKSGIHRLRFWKKELELTILKIGQWSWSCRSKIPTRLPQLIRPCWSIAE